MMEIISVILFVLPYFCTMIAVSSHGSFSEYSPMKYISDGLRQSKNSRQLRYVLNNESPFSDYIYSNPVSRYYSLKFWWIMQTQGVCARCTGQHTLRRPQIRKFEESNLYIRIFSLKASHTSFKLQRILFYFATRACPFYTLFYSFACHFSTIVWLMIEINSFLAYVRKRFASSCVHKAKYSLPRDVLLHLSGQIFRRLKLLINPRNTPRVRPQTLQENFPFFR
jgi:hypothetical protein